MHLCFMEFLGEMDGWMSESETEGCKGEIYEAIVEISDTQLREGHVAVGSC